MACAVERAQAGLKEIARDPARGAWLLYDLELALPGSSGPLRWSIFPAGPLPRSGLAVRVSPTYFACKRIIFSPTYAHACRIRRGSWCCLNYMQLLTRPTCVPRRARGLWLVRNTHGEPAQEHGSVRNTEHRNRAGGYPCKNVYGELLSRDPYESAGPGAAGDLSRYSPL